MVPPNISFRSCLKERGMDLHLFHRYQHWIFETHKYFLIFECSRTNSNFMKMLYLEKLMVNRALYCCITFCPFLAFNEPQRHEALKCPYFIKSVQKLHGLENIDTKLTISSWFRKRLGLYK